MARASRSDGSIEMLPPPPPESLSPPASPVGGPIPQGTDGSLAPQHRNLELFLFALRVGKGWGMGGGMGRGGGDHDADLDLGAHSHPGLTKPPFQQRSMGLAEQDLQRLGWPAGAVLSLLAR